MAKIVPDYVATSLTHLLHRASQYAEELFAGVAAREGLTARQLIVMKIVADGDRPSQIEICDKSGIDRSTLADIVRRLTKKGYLARRRTREDARRYAVRLTDEGARILESTLPKAREADFKLVAVLSPEQREQLMETLRLVLKMTGTSKKRLV